MPIISKTVLFFAVLAVAGQLGVPLEAQTAPPPASATSQIRSVLARQQTAWNRGDTDAFLAGYDSKTTFVGDKITRGLSELRVRYQSHYPTRESMGQLTFSDVEVHMLGSDYAYVIGHWRLERSAAAGGDTGGNFTLVFRHTEKGWKIILDHTT